MVAMALSPSQNRDGSWMSAVKTLVSDAERLLKTTVQKATHFIHEKRTPDTEFLPKSAETLLKKRFLAERPLNTFFSGRTRPRVNLITDSLDANNLYGGVGTALIFAALVAQRRGCDLRIITRWHRAHPHSFVRIMQIAGLTAPGSVEFKFADYEEPAIDVELGASELFITTSWWSTASALLTIAPHRILYLLQEDERMFYPYGDDHLRCTELLSNPALTFVINSKLLYDHLGSELPGLASRGLWFEPAFPADVFFAEPPAGPAEPLRFFFYARSNNSRNLFHRGLEAIKEAVASGVLDPARWELSFVGKDIPLVTLPGGAQPRRYENLPWHSYAALVRKMDLGLSLMYTPHPSYPPLDLAASGAVVVTNRFGNKRSLEQYSRNILCVEPSCEQLVAGLERGVQLAQDRLTRQANYQHSGLLRDWRTAFGEVLDKLAPRFPS